MTATGNEPMFDGFALQDIDVGETTLRDGEA